MLESCGFDVPHCFGLIFRGASALVVLRREGRGARERASRASLIRAVQPCNCETRLRASVTFVELRRVSRTVSVYIAVLRIGAVLYLLY